MKPVLLRARVGRATADAARAVFEARDARLERIESERLAELAEKRQELAKNQE